MTREYEALIEKIRRECSHNELVAFCRALLTEAKFEAIIRHAVESGYEIGVCEYDFHKGDPQMASATSEALWLDKEWQCRLFECDHYEEVSL